MSLLELPGPNDKEANKDSYFYQIIINLWLLNLNKIFYTKRIVIKKIIPLKKIRAVAL